jgi:hypothetical protein
MEPNPVAVAVAAGVLLTLAGMGAAAAPDARAEVQINLCAAPADIARRLQLGPAGTLESWYFDSADLALSARGFVVRLRTGDGAPSLTLKAADQDCAAVKPELLPRGEGKCEYDFHGPHPKGAVSLSRDLSREAARELIDGRLALEQALSPAQIRFLQAAGSWPLPAGLQRMGPVAIRAYRRADAKYVVEAWTLPGGEPFVEISEKARLAGAPAVLSRLEAMLDRAGVARCADQSSQARRKLEAMTGRP